MEYALRTHGLTKTYGKTNVVNRVNMNVQKGDIYGFIGKNGAGKTSLMKMVCGLTVPNQGDMELFGNGNLRMERQRIGCVIEQPALYPGMTARQNLMYYDKIQGITDDRNIDEVLDLVGLTHVGKKKNKKFSLGMKQRLSIAISLIGNPDFLILDEPINGLDPAGIKEIRELLLRLNQEKNITILISSHILGELSKIATNYGVIDNGNLIDEFNSFELEERCKQCIKVEVDDSNKAVYILEHSIGSKDFTALEQGKICIYDCLDRQAEINSVLVQNGIAVSHLSIEGEDLEDYFMKMMGGEK